MRKTKKLFTLLIVLLSFMLFFSTAASAASEGTNNAPDLVITKLAQDTVGKDRHEALEIVNTSGAPLNLYEYTLCYNGSVSGDESYGKIMEVTPFKKGDIRDESTWTMENMPNNPDTFVMNPGEIVVVRVLTPDAIDQNVTETEFRTHWSIPDSVRIIDWDGNSNAEKGGHDNNFNLKNSGTAAYGIAKISDQIVIGETTFDSIESYVTYTYGVAPLPEKTTKEYADCALIFGYNGTKTMDALQYVNLQNDEAPVRFGTLTQAQIDSLGDLLKASEPDTPATEAPASPEATESTNPGTGDISVTGYVLLAVAVIGVLAVIGVFCVLRKKSRA